MLRFKEGQGGGDYPACDALDILVRHNIKAASRCHITVVLLPTRSSHSTCFCPGDHQRTSTCFCPGHHTALCALLEAFVTQFVTQFVTKFVTQFVTSNCANAADSDSPALDAAWLYKYCPTWVLDVSILHTSTAAARLICLQTSLATRPVSRPNHTQACLHAGLLTCRYTNQELASSGRVDWV